MSLAIRPRRAMKKFLGDNRGANLVEYVLLVGLIAILALVAFRFFGKSVSSKVQQQANTVNTQINGM